MGTITHVGLTLTAVLFICTCPAYGLEGMVLQTSTKMFDGGNLTLHYISTGERTTIRSGSIYGPSFSPDGKKVAYGDESARKICIVDIDGSNRVEVTSCGNAEPVVTWAGNGYLYFGYNDRNIYRVKPDGSDRSIVFTSNSNIHAVGVSQSGTRAAWTKPAWSVAVADISTGTERNFGSGCQGSVSPDGQFVTHNLGGHTECKIKRWDGSTWKTLSTPEGHFNLHRWAHHAQDYICYTIEDNNKGYIHNVNTNTATAIGTGISWDYFPDEVYAGPAAPSLSISPASLDFTGTLGEAASPSSATVSVTNTTAGTTMDNVTVSGAPAWLTVTRSGSGNTQTLTNAIDMGAISVQDVYEADVTVTAANADPSTRTYHVRLTVQTAPVLTSITVTPSVANVQPSGTIQFSASARDQYGSAMASQPTISWEATGGGAVDAAGLFTAGTQEGGPFEVRASAGGQTGTAQVSVSEAPPLHLKLNCGGTGVAGWDSEEPYLVAGSTGSAFDFGSDADVTGVTDAAPAAVYSTVRHYDHQYDFADIPDGTYTVRFHFNDAYGAPERAMDYTVEGDKVIDGLNIGEAAGGGGIALVMQFDVSVSDGNGLQIVCESGDGNDVFESGIEIISATPVQQQAVAVTQPAAGFSVQQGEALTVAWDVDCGQVPGVKVELTLDEGETWTVIEESGTLPCGLQTWQWTVPETIQAGGVTTSTVSDLCMVRVANYMGSGEDLSPLFSITEGDMVVGRQTPAHHRQAAPLAVGYLHDGAIVVSVNVASAHRLHVVSLSGRTAHVSTADGTVRHCFAPRELSGGMYLAILTNAEGHEVSRARITSH